MEEGEKETERKGMLGLSRFVGASRIGKFMKEGEIDLTIPENPGPSVVGREPVFGTIRRGMGLPVLRDEVPTLIELEK